MPAALAVLAAILNTWDLSRNGMANDFYAAAVKSGTVSWKALIFASLDPGSFITVDKPPVAIWVQALSGRLLGFSSWSMLLPQALAGVVIVLVVYRLVRRWMGEAAGACAGVFMALTPVAVAMFRFNNPDAMLTLLLVLAAWALWSALETGSIGRLVASGALIGLAFTTKMLEALLVIPAFALVYLVCERRSLLRRLRHLLAATAAFLAAAGWWPILVALWPSTTRPYVGGSKDNSALGLALSRNAGYVTAGHGPEYAGSPGAFRIFNAHLGDQISWFLPLALLGLIAGLWLARRRPRSDLSRGGFLLWGGWAVVSLAVFSGAADDLHPYITVVLAPAVAALAGGGAVALWRLSSARRRLCWVLPAGIVGSAAWSAVLLQRDPGYLPGLSLVVLGSGCLGALLLLVLFAARYRHSSLGWLRKLAIVLSAAALLAGPFAYCLSTVSRSVTGNFAAAGPEIAAARSTPGGGGGSGKDDTSSQALIAYLEQHRAGATYLVAVETTPTAVPFILATGQPVIAMGGFRGSDPVPTLSQFKSIVSAGGLHYVLVSGGQGSIRSQAMTEVIQWVVSNGIVVRPSEYGSPRDRSTLYYVGPT